MHVTGEVGPSRKNADAYEALLNNKVLPSLKNIEGYRGGYLLRSDGAREVRRGAI